jgi:hypothetical protein
LRSGEYFGKNTRRAPTARIAFLQAAVTLRSRLSGPGPATRNGPPDPNIGLVPRAAGQASAPQVTVKAAEQAVSAVVAAEALA